MKKSAVTLNLIAILICISQDGEASCTPFTDIRIRSNAWDEGKKIESFFKPPLNDCDEVPADPPLPDTIRLLCPRKRTRICIMEDNHKNIVGVEVSINKQDVANVDPRWYNYSSVQEFIKTNDSYKVRIYFFNPANNLTDACRPHRTEVADGIWVDMNGKIVQADRCQPNSPSMGEYFDMQGCTHRMGQYFVYELTRYTNQECKKGFYLLIFLYNQEGHLVGVSFNALGKPSRITTSDWFSRLTLKLVLEKKILPSIPPCFSNIVRRYHLFSADIFLVQDPWNIRCQICAC